MADAADDLEREIKVAIAEPQRHDLSRRVGIDVDPVVLDIFGITLGPGGLPI
ncbi:hypothetical protein D3C78_1914250 [compost metagenome]